MGYSYCSLHPRPVALTREKTRRRVIEVRQNNLASNPPAGTQVLEAIFGKVWVRVTLTISRTLKKILTDYVIEGTFSKRWKTAKLILLRKESKPSESPSAYRLICLLDDVGKIFERIIANRIVRHLSRNGLNLSPVSMALGKRDRQSMPSSTFGPSRSPSRGMDGGGGWRWQYLWISPTSLIASRGAG